MSSFFGGLFRRVEQGVLQTVGLVQSSLNEKEYTEDESRLETLEGLLKLLVDQQVSYQQAIHRAAEGAVNYACSLERCISSFSSNGSGGVTAVQSMDLKPLLRVLIAQKNAVVATNEQHLATGIKRLGKLQKDLGVLRAEFNSRKDKVLDHDSYTRRQQQAEQALAACVETVKKVEAREALRKAEGKVKDSVAVVAQMSSRLRSKLCALEVATCSEASESALALLALQVHSSGHASETCSSLLPSYPGSAQYLCSLGVATVDRANTLLLSTSQQPVGSKGGRPTSTANLAFADSPYESMSAALRAPYAMPAPSALPESFVAAADAAPFAAMHSGSTPKNRGDNSSPTPSPPGQQAINFRPPGNLPGPSASARMGVLSSSSGGGDARTAAEGDESPQVISLGEFSAGSAAAAQSVSPDATSISSSWACALFDYTPSQPDELALSRGAMVYVTSTAASGDENWMSGFLNGKGEVGVFPSNYAKFISLSEVKTKGLPLTIPHLHVGSVSASGEGEGAKNSRGVEEGINSAVFSFGGIQAQVEGSLGAEGGAAASSPDPSALPQSLQPQLPRQPSPTPTFESIDGGTFDFS